MRILLLIISSTFFLTCNKLGNTKRYIDSNDTTYTDEIRAITKDINDDPENAELYFKRALAFKNKKNFNEAIADLDFAIELKPNNEFYYLKKGLFYIEKDTADAQNSLKAFKKCLELKPDYTQAKIELGKLQIALLQYPEASKIFSELIKNNPSNPEGYLYYGIILKETKDTINAIKMFEKAILYNSENYDANMQLANVYSNKKNKSAISYFDNALKINEFSDEALYGKGLFLQNMGEYDKALSFYERTIKINEFHRFAYYNKAFCLIWKKKYEDAENSLKTVLSQDKNYSNAYHLLGFVYELQGKKELALENYNKALALDKTNLKILESISNLK